MSISPIPPINDPDPGQKNRSIKRSLDADQSESAGFVPAFEQAVDQRSNDKLPEGKKNNAASLPVSDDGLSQAEKQMIYQFFPEVPGMALRIYQSDSSAKKVDPSSLGSRLDLKG